MSRPGETLESLRAHVDALKRSNQVGQARNEKLRIQLLAEVELNAELEAKVKQLRASLQELMERKHPAIRMLQTRDARIAQLVEALEAIAPFLPTLDEGPVRHSAHAQAAGLVRAALAEGNTCRQCGHFACECEPPTDERDARIEELEGAIRLMSASLPRRDAKVRAAALEEAAQVTQEYCGCSPQEEPDADDCVPCMQAAAIRALIGAKS